MPIGTNYGFLLCVKSTNSKDTTKPFTVQKLRMLNQKQQFYLSLDEHHTCSSLLTKEKISDFINVLSQPCPSSRGAERQRYYRLKKKYIIKEFHDTKYLYEFHLPNPLRIVAKEDLLIYSTEFTRTEVDILGEIDSLQN